MKYLDDLSIQAMNEALGEMTYLGQISTQDEVDEALSALAIYWVGSRDIAHYSARTVEEAVSLLDENVGKAAIVAGGVDLLRLMKNQVVVPKVLVNIKTITGLAGISEDAEGLKLGSLTTIKDIEQSALIRNKYGILTQAAHRVASPHVRNMATVSGNLCQEVNCWYYRRSPLTGISFSCYRKGGTGCHAVNGDNRYHAIISDCGCHSAFTSDMAPALMAMDARLKIASSTGERVVPIEDFYVPPGTILKPNELITEIQLPTPRPGARQQYLKFGVRKTIDPALSSVALVITTDAGKVADARIVLGGVAPAPYRSTEAEAVIRGRAITEGLAEAAAEAAVSRATPLAMNAYKIPLTKALVRRAIAEV